jgi:hypothetical protein
LLYPRCSKESSHGRAPGDPATLVLQKFKLTHYLLLMLLALGEDW